MVTIHDHASSTTVMLYGINGSINICRSSPPPLAEIDCVAWVKRSSAAARTLLFEYEDTLRRSCSTKAMPRRYRGQG